MPRKKITHGGPRAWGLCGLGGPGSGLTAGASLRKATSIECDPALAVCARLLTIEIFLTRNIGLRQTQRARAAQDVSKFQFPGLPGPKRAQQGPAAGECGTRPTPPARRQSCLSEIIDRAPKEVIEILRTKVRNAPDDLVSSATIRKPCHHHSSRTPASGRACGAPPGKEAADRVGLPSGRLHDGGDGRALAVEHLNHPGLLRIPPAGLGRLLRSLVPGVLAMALHELATNAAKYGALSVAKGHVRVEWSRAGDDDHLVLRWTEAGGPPVNQPARKGFGTHVMEAMIRGHVGGDVRLDWHAEGLACEMTLPM
jgi:hypothetical protein